MKKLSFLDKNLSLWIFLAMALGVLLSRYFETGKVWLDFFQSGSTNYLLAVGLILMMFPPLAKVDFKLLPLIFKEKKILLLSLVLNWIIGPLLMFGLGLLFFSDQINLFSGLILIGIARCIAMVIVWNDLADGDPEYAASLVAINSVFQMLTYSLYAYFFISVAPAYFGNETIAVNVPMMDIVESVLIYLGIPFLMAIITRWIMVKKIGVEAYKSKFIPKIAPLTLVFLLFTIVLMFYTQGNKIIETPLLVVKVAIPLAIYFVLMFFVSYFSGRFLGASKAKNTALAFTAAGNNFELAIAVAIGIFGIESPQAFVGVIGPLIEVPVLLLLVKVVPLLERKFY